ncbi:MAG: zinc-dependent alcohol dehydrogenase family protein, partial [Acidimicrobiales bacterium]
SHLSDVEAATLVCAGHTAWSSLQTASITAGDVVVTLGTGGVSLYTLQLGKAMGAAVVVTSSSNAKLEVARSLGADHVVNYDSTPDWESQVLEITEGRGADLVVDLGGADTLRRSVAATRMDGTVAVVGVLSGFGAAEISVTDVMTRQIRLHGISVGSVAGLADLAAAVSANELRPHVSHQYDWTELADAQRCQQAGEHVGKIGITIPEDPS